MDAKTELRDKLKSALKAPSTGRLSVKKNVVQIQELATPSRSHPTKPAYRPKFRDIANKLTTKQKRSERATVVFLEGSLKKRNLAYYDQTIYSRLKLRKQIQIIHKGRDATPIPLVETDLTDVKEDYEEQKKQRTESLWDKLIEDIKCVKFEADTSALQENHFKIKDMDEITTEVIDRADSSEFLDIETTLKHIKDDRNQHPSAKKPKHFIKLTLTETDDIVLYETASLTVPKGTEEAAAVEKYNADYEYITKGAGKNRRTSDAEVQTENLLVKSRSANTDRIKREEKGSFVSNFEMFDTYAEIARNTKELELDDEDHRKIEITTYVREGTENYEENLSKSDNFQLSSMILQRLLAGNVYRDRQKRFRNMIIPDPLDLNVKYLYRLETLWSYKSVETMGKDVVDMSWCHDNGDMLAIAYGVYNYRDSKNRISGAVLIWSIKNPVNPERRYRYKIPVTAVAFSKMRPQLLAVALYNGTVEILDITDNAAADDFSVVARSERKSSPGFEPIWQIQWIQVKDVEYILTASQDGRIFKFKISSGPYLVGYPQLRLDRVEGSVEALSSIEHKKTFIEADRHPQALCLQKHPENPDTYLVGTDEGCVHICSTNFPHQHIGVLQVHNGGVYSIDFSPFSPKIFLTAGSDWTIRIWIENIFEPIMELSDGFGAIHNAYWSPIHSTIIASCTQNAVQIWDLRRKNQKPASIRTFDKQLTVIKFSQCGRSLIVGDNEGNTHVCGLEDFPFAPHYQYDELQKALYHSLTNKQDLEKIKQLGYLGYPKEKKEAHN